MAFKAFCQWGNTALVDSSNLSNRVAACFELTFRRFLSNKAYLSWAFVHMRAPNTICLISYLSSYQILITFVILQHSRSLPTKSSLFSLLLLSHPTPEIPFYSTRCTSIFRSISKRVVRGRRFFLQLWTSNFYPTNMTIYITESGKKTNVFKIN